MARVARAHEYPNVLVVFGDDLYDTNPDNPDRRGSLTRILNGKRPGSPSRAGLVDFWPDGTSPVRHGTHDFWVTLGPPYGKDFPGPDHGDEDAAARPRPLRGRTNIALPADTQNGQQWISDTIGTLMEEIGHHWLVPRDLAITIAGHPVPIDGNDYNEIQSGRSFTGPLLFGREDAPGIRTVHWSSYFQADISPFDGVFWQQQESDGTTAHWVASPTWHPVVTPSGLPAMSLVKTFNDLDLLVMGVKRPEECYTQSGGQLTWMEPQVAAPLDSYFVGLFVALTRQDDFLYFGFSQDHRQLIVERTGGRDRTVVPLPDLRPFANSARYGVALRVVRHDGVYDFQARYDNSLLHSGQQQEIPSLFQDINLAGRPQSAANFDDGFRTVATITEGRNPQAIGLMASTTAPNYLWGRFFNLETFVPMHGVPGRDPIPASHQTHRLDAHMPTMQAGAPFSDLPQGQPMLDCPAPNVRLDQAGGRLTFMLPSYPPDDQPQLPNPPFPHDATRDAAPKVVLRPPSSPTFAFGTSTTVRLALFRRSSGLSVEGMHLWGSPKSASPRQVVVPADIKAKQVPPLQGTYKMAFIIYAKQMHDLGAPVIGLVDQLRQYWDAAFAAATAGRRHSDSSL